jgi:desampylase
MWGMHLTISSQHQRQLLEFARQAGDVECCGLLLGRDNVVERVELTQNVAAEPSAAFEIHPAALIAAEKRIRRGGLPILGYFHSHPTGRCGPSAEDIRQAAVDGRCWLIIADDHISAWVPVGGQGGQPKIFAAISYSDG